MGYTLEGNLWILRLLMCLRRNLKTEINEIPHRKSTHAEHYYSGPKEETENNPKAIRANTS